MAWRNLRLFLLESRKLQPDAIMKKLQQFKFDGQEGINSFETWREFNELRFQYLFVLPKYIRISRLKGREMEEEKMKVETIAKVDIHIRSSGIIEAYGSPLLIERAMDAISILGDIDQIIFSQRDFRKMMRAAADIRKVKVHGTTDERVSEITLKGGFLLRSSEVKKYTKTGQIQEIQGKLDLRTGAFGFAMKENEVRFFVKDEVEDQADIEFFVDMVTKQD